MSSGHYSKRTTRTVYSSSSDGQPGQQRSNVTETVSYTDSDGRVHTQTTNNQSGEFQNSNHGHHHTASSRPIHESFGQRLMSSVMETAAGGTKRYTSGWGNRKSSRPTATKTISTQGKSFAEIKKQCLAEGVLFEDPEFPAINTSIFYSQRPPRPFEWKRPPVSKHHNYIYIKFKTRP